MLGACKQMQTHTCVHTPTMQTQQLYCVNIRMPVFHVHTYSPTALSNWGLFTRGFPQNPPALSGNRGRSWFAFVLPQMCRCKCDLLLFTHNAQRLTGKVSGTRS